MADPFFSRPTGPFAALKGLMRGRRARRRAPVGVWSYSEADLEAVDRSASLKSLRGAMAGITELAAQGRLREAADLALKVVDDPQVEVGNVQRAISPFLRDHVADPIAAEVIAAFLRRAGPEVPVAQRLIDLSVGAGNAGRMEAVLSAAHPSSGAISAVLIGDIRFAAGAREKAVAAWREAHKQAEDGYARRLAEESLRSTLGSSIAGPADRELQKEAAISDRRYSGRVAVLVEPGADPGAFLKDPRFADCELVLYANDKLAPPAAGSHPVQLGMLRDKVPDHSEASHAIYAFARPLSETVTRAAIERLSGRPRQIFEAQEEVFALALEDRMTSHLTILECFKAVIDEEYARCNSIVLLCQGGDTLLKGAPYLLDGKDPTRFSILSAERTQASRLRNFARALDSSTRPPEPPVWADERLHASAETYLQRLDELVTRYAKRQAAMLAPGYTLVISHFGQPHYRATAEALCARLRERGDALAVFDVHAASWDAQSIEDFLAPERGNAPVVIHSGWINARLFIARGEEFFQTWFASLRSIATADAAYRGVSLPALIDWLSHNAINQVWPSVLARTQLAAALFSQSAPAIVYVSPSRIPWARGAAVAAQAAGAPVIDVQTLNALPHPKYRRPAADAITVIDDISKDIHAEYLGFPEAHIHAVGSPRVDEIRDATLQADSVALVTRYGLSKSEKPRMLFASQLQPLPRCLSILGRMAKISAETGHELIIKMHPREGLARKRAYEEAAAAAGATRTTLIVTDGPINEVLALSAVVVTMFSNVAREALIARRAVVIANYFDTELPIRFDGQAGGVGAYSEDELELRVREALARAETEGVLSGAAGYFERNPHLVGGDAAANILAVGDARATPVKRSRAAGAPSALSPEEIADLTVDGLLSQLRFMLQTPRARRAAVTTFVRLPEHCPGWEAIWAQAAAAALAAPLTANLRQRVLSVIADTLARISRERTRLDIALVLAETLDEFLAVADQRNARPDREGDGEAAQRWREVLADAFASAGRYREAWVYAEIALARLDGSRRNANTTKRLRGYPPLPVNTDEEAYATLTRDEGEGVLIVFARGSDRRAMSELLSMAPKASVFTQAPSELLEAGVVPTELLGPNDILHDESDFLRQALKTVVEDFASAYTQSAIRTLKGTELGRFTVRHRHAFETLMRAGLIDATRQQITHQIVCRRGWKAIFIVGQAPEWVENHRPAWVEDAAPPTFVLVSDAVALRRGSLIDALSKCSAAPAPSERLGPPGSRAVLIAAINAEPETPPAQFASGGSKRLLFAVRWKLKTVPLTIAPLLEAAPADTAVTILSVGDREAYDELCEAVAAINRTRRSQLPITVATTSDISRGAPPWSEELVRHIWSGCCDSKALYRMGVDISAVAARRVQTLSSGWFSYLSVLEKSVSRFFDGADEAAIAVCPGRFAEPTVIEEVARRRGVRSVDVQNAYMTSGYTYKAPTADIITAIDKWSVDLLTGHYGLPRERVKMVGTPRFDAIPAAIRDAEARSERAVIDLPFEAPERPLVMFAAQPGLYDLNNRIMRAILRARATTGPFNAILKLHPRDPDGLAVSHEAALSPYAGPNHLEVVRDADLYGLIAHCAIVATIYSNVGVEAAIWDKDVIVANPDADPLPLPLDEFGLGWNARSEDEITEAVERLLGDAEARAQNKRRRAAYIEANAHLARGDSRQAIWRILEDAMAAPSKPRG